MDIDKFISEVLLVEFGNVTDVTVHRILQQARLEYRLHKTKQTLDLKIARATVVGEITGRNEEERKACRLLLFAPLYNKIDKTEQLLILVKAELACAVISNRYSENLLKLAELSLKA